MQVNERFLKALLDDIFRVFPVASEAQDDAKNPCLITADQNFKRLVATALGGGNQGGFIFFRGNRLKRDRCC